MKLCAELVQAVENNKVTVTVVAGAVLTAISSTWPEQRPKTLDDWWNWVRDLVRQIGNSRHPSLPK